MNELLERLLSGAENYDLEFKQAKNNFDLKDLHDYCAAIANERGGFLLLGVNDKGDAVGTSAFGSKWNTLAHKLTEHLKIRIRVHLVKHVNGRVLMIEIPAHPTGVPVQSIGGKGKYRYPIRDGESLTEMHPQTLQEIFAEREEDWSAMYAQGATLADLDEDALRMYRGEWARHSGNDERTQTPLDQMLSDLGLADAGGVTNAALLLFGTEAGLRRYIPNAEIILEWRNSKDDIAYGDRKNWRAGFMRVHDEVWRAVNSRNTAFRYQEGFVQRDILAYDEESVREAVVNAVVHRDYTITGRSVRIKVSPEVFFVENPGRLMPGITVENILDKSAWRNRLLAESLEKVHIMERSSQGMDKIFQRAIEDGKGAPNIVVTPDPSIELTIPAKLADQEFVNFLQQIANERQVNLTVKEIIELEGVRSGRANRNLQFKDKFLELGVIERVGHGRGSKYVLSHRYYTATHAKGQHTRLTALSKDVKRAIVIAHLEKNGQLTSHELQDAMPDLSPGEISTLLKGMRKDGIIRYEGRSPRWGYWHLKSHKEPYSA